MIFKKSFAAGIRTVTLVLVLAASILICTFSSCAQTETVYSRKNFLRTSYNPDSYSLFEIQGKTVYARGKYSDDRIRKIFFPGIEDISGTYKLHINSDGSYEAEFTLPDGYRYTNICIRLNSGAEFGYRVDYLNGWFFPDNGLSEKNKQVFDNIITDSPEAAGYYLSETADEAEIAAVLEQIKTISDSVTEGIEGDYAKARALCRYVAAHYYYDHDARNVSVTESNVVLSEVLKTAKTVCTGFADLYCALLQAQGIDAVNIKGGSTGDEITYEMLTDGVMNHEFTAFFYEEEQRWVWVDSCWCGSGDYLNGKYMEDKPHEEFFDITHEALALDHRADYAVRRDFFGAKAAKKTETAETSPPVEETSSETTTTALTTEESLAEDETADVSADSGTPEKEDNTILIIAIVILGIGVILTGTTVVINIIKAKKGKDY